MSIWKFAVSTLVVSALLFNLQRKKEETRIKLKTGFIVSVDSTQLVVERLAMILSMTEHFHHSAR